MNSFRIYIDTDALVADQMQPIAARLMAAALTGKTE